MARYIKYIEKNATNIRDDLDIQPSDKLIALSTCVDAATNGRALVIGRLTKWYINMICSQSSIIWSPDQVYHHIIYNKKYFQNGKAFSCENLPVFCLYQSEFIINFARIFIHPQLYPKTYFYYNKKQNIDLNLSKAWLKIINLLWFINFLFNFIKKRNYFLKIW